MTTDRPRGGGALRALSLIAAAACVALIVLYPRAFGHDATQIAHGPFVGMLAGMSILWVHGLDFKPDHPVARRLLSPLLGWALLLGFGAIGLIH